MKNSGGDGHAYKCFKFADGSRLVEFSTVDDRLHSTSGPARVEYRADGSVRYAQYWRHGSLIPEGSINESLAYKAPKL